MPDPQAPEQTQDTPTPTDDATPETQDTDAPSTDSEPSVDWQKRYSDLQPEYTRASQEAAQYRQIIELARQGDPEAIKALGFDLADTEDEEPDFDAEEPLTRAEFEQWQRQLQEQQQAEAADAQWQDAAEAKFDEFIKKSDASSYGEEYLDLLIDIAQPGEDGLPDFEGAHKRQQALIEAQRQKWVQTKRTPQAPSGSSPSHQPNLDDREERREYMARMAAQFDA